MNEKYKIKNVVVSISKYISLNVELTNLSDLKDLMEDLRAAGYESALEDDGRESTEKEKVKKSNDDDNPASKVETRAELTDGILTSKKILGFKNDKPQLYRPSAIAAAEALLVLLFAVENGLNLNKIAFDDFKSIFEGQGIKTGTPMHMLVNNAKNSNYIDKKVYDSSRLLTLTSKGADKAKEILKKLATT